MTKYDPHKHHRRSIRLKGWDYSSAGAYFITICVKGGQHLLGEVVDYDMVLSQYGYVVQETWQSLAERYPYVILDAAVIMPNHFHGIISSISGEKSAELVENRPKLMRDTTIVGTNARGSHPMNRHPFASQNSISTHLYLYLHSDLSHYIRKHSILSA